MKRMQTFGKKIHPTLANNQMKQFNNALLLLEGKPTMHFFNEILNFFGEKSKKCVKLRKK